jgi:hypothetical protein
MCLVLIHVWYLYYKEANASERGRRVSVKGNLDAVLTSTGLEIQSQGCAASSGCSQEHLLAFVEPGHLCRPALSSTHTVATPAKGSSNSVVCPVDQSRAVTPAQESRTERKSALGDQAARVQPLSYEH